jgi:hypothetical protein
LLLLLLFLSELFLHLEALPLYTLLLTSLFFLLLLEFFLLATFLFLHLLLEDILKFLLLVLLTLFVEIMEGTEAKTCPAC